MSSEDISIISSSDRFVEELENPILMYMYNYVESCKDI